MAKLMGRLAALGAARKYASKHSDQVHGGIDKVAGMVRGRAGGHAVDAFFVTVTAAGVAGAAAGAFATDHARGWRGAGDEVGGRAQHGGGHGGRGLGRVHLGRRRRRGPGGHGRTRS